MVNSKVRQVRAERRTTQVAIVLEAARVMQDRSDKPYRRRSILNGQDPETGLYYTSPEEYKSALVELGALTASERSTADELDWMLTHHVSPHLYGEAGWDINEAGVWSQLPDRVLN